MSSKELMDVLDTAETEISSLRNDINTIKTDLSNKLHIFQNAMEYTASMTSKYNEFLVNDEQQNVNTIMLNEATVVESKTAQYGLTVHPAYSSTPTNVLNIESTTGPIFKNNANIYLNEESSPFCLPMLMHDAIKGQSTAFDETALQDFTLRIEINPNDLFGSTACNTIEMHPFIPGSFDITEIRLFTMSDYRSSATIPTLTISKTMKDVGAGRIILPKTYDMYAVEFDIHMTFMNSNSKYPFGFRHIYFLHANYNSDCYTIIELTRNNYIDWISENIVIHDQNGIRNTTCTDEGIEIYSEYSSGELSYQVTPTKGTIQSTIARNTKTLYVKIPIDKSIISLKFKQIGER